MSGAEVIVILERTTWGPGDPESPGDMERFMLDDWCVVAVQAATTKKGCSCAGRGRLCDVCAVEEEIGALRGVRLLWGDDVPEGLTPEAGKILVRGTMRWVHVRHYYEPHEMVPEFDLAELRVLAPLPPAPPAEVTS